MRTSTASAATGLGSAAPLRTAPGWLALGVGLGLLAGCAGPDPLQPVLVSSPVLNGRTITWTTTQPALGEVRWGRHAGLLDHTAYPEAPTADRAFTTDHAVPLLSLATGESVYVQVAARTSGAATVVGSLQGFKAAVVPATPPLLVWTMIDVGWGDSHLLTMPNSGERVLIDAGERRDAANVERYLTDAGVTRLDAVVATHAHEDHIGGMVGEWSLPDDGVLAALPVGELVEGSPVSARRSAYDELVALCAARSIPRVVVARGATDATSAAIAWDPQVHVTVLNAGGGRTIGGETESEWLNNDSIVMRLTYGNVSVMLGGDAESPVEALMMQSDAVLQASLLKVHHHGSADAGDATYLAAVRPRVGMVPIASYEVTPGSLPSSIVLQRLRDLGAGIYASDRAEPLGIQYAGDAGQNVTVVTDGRSYEVAVAPSASRHWAPDGPAALTSGGTP